MLNRKINAEDATPAGPKIAIVPPVDRNASLPPQMEV